VDSQPSEPRDRCKGCNAPIVWVRTSADRLIPCDPAVLTVVTDDGRIVRGRESHFATCPRASAFRTPKRRKDA
jgi:hypothetical protein